MQGGHLIFNVGQSDIRLYGCEGGARESPGEEGEEE